ncbi:hypothetical protein NS206_05225 [Microbacterium testaceum]|nr:hypothetical protein NS206_05225 [Microbacterium testaceum]
MPTRRDPAHRRSPRDGVSDSQLRRDGFESRHQTVAVVDRDDGPTRDQPGERDAAGGWCSNG